VKEEKIAVGLRTTQGQVNTIQAETEGEGAGKADENKSREGCFEDSYLPRSLEFRTSKT